MAGAKPGVHVVQLKPISVPESLQKGNKFIKWEDESTQGTVVTLKVDPKGYILYWKDQNKEMECMEISLIRDTRTGKYARFPKEGKLRDSCMRGSPDIPLEEKTVTVVYGTDMVNHSFVNFVANTQEIAKEWTHELMKYCENLLALNGSVTSFLEKTYAKLSLVTNAEGKICVKNITKLFAQSRDDRKKVEKALESAGLPSGKNDSISPSKFTFEDFFNFYSHLTQRKEIDEIFHDIGAKNKPYLTVDQFQDFLNKRQRDPRLNEILYPYVNRKKAQEIMNTFEKNKSMAQKGLFSQEAFLRYLLDEDNLPIPAEKYDLNEDMNQPLTHYFINSSHNTYLTGHQLTGKSSVEIYRQVLLSGCRCIELDCWDGKNAEEEPIITHGYTMCTEISFKEVIEAIGESAFKTSDYPVILSFENHCNPRQQAKMAEHCRRIFGEMLLTEPLEDFQLIKGAPLPSPERLLRRVIIKNKKSHHVHQQTWKTPSTVTKKSSNTETPDESIVSDSGDVSEKNDQVNEDDDVSDASDSESDDEEALSEEAVKMRQKVKKEKGTAGSEAAAASEMSALVNYVLPVHFHSFESAEKKDRSYEISSFVETQAMAKLKEQPVDFVNYNKRQMSRIYPKGTRVDSSNFMPQVFWNAGCQLVALNFQTLDLAMQLNLGRFEYNACSGYILKPEFMRRNDRHFDPFAESTVDGIVAGTMSIKILSGQFLTERKIGTYVEVDMYGLPADTVRKKFRTKIIPSNGINPMYNEEPFVFKKVVLPNLAQLRISASDETGRFLGHRIIPVEGLRPGYRHISLRNVCNQPLTLPTLFVCITVNDYVPVGFSDFADALANPIAYQSARERHEKQLEVLTDDFDVDEEIETSNAKMRADMREESKMTPQQRAQSVSNIYIKNDTNIVEISDKTNGNMGTRSTSMHVGISHQDSNISGFSQGSSGSGSAFSQVPGGMSDNDASVPPAQIAINRVTKLEFAKPTPVDELKLLKPIKKLKSAETKVIEKLWQKHNRKVKGELHDKHQLKLEHMEILQALEMQKLEKSHKKSLKKASRKGNEQAVQLEINEAVESLARQHSKNLQELKCSQSQEMMAVHKEYCKKEFDYRMKLHGPYHEILHRVSVKHQATQLKRFQKIQKKETNILKKTLDAHNKLEMKVLAKKHRNKEELQRIKREAQNKHIVMAVAEINKLRPKLKQMETKLVEANKEILKSVDAEKEEAEKQIKKEYKEKCEEAEKEYQLEMAEEDEMNENEEENLEKINSQEELTDL